MACDPLQNLVRECGKSASGLRDEVYLVPFDKLVPVTGSTEVYSTGVTGLISTISFATGTTKFAKYGATKNQNAITEGFVENENGSYDITKELTFTITGMGTIAAREAITKLIGNPVVALVKMRSSGQILVFGLNGQFSMSGSAGEVNATGNQRVITLRGSDTELTHLLDPTLLPSLI